MNSYPNPFDITKAVDFTDAEIKDTWVTWPSNSIQSVVDPRSPMPTFLAGGKGGGRTHLLRHYSYPLQRLRHADDLLNGLQNDGYIGVYLRCGGLNSSRFAGKGHSSDQWAAVFAFYMDVWLGRMTLDLIADLYASAELPLDSPEIGSFVDDVVALFDAPLHLSDIRSFRVLRRVFEEQQRAMDVTINNVPLTGDLTIPILASPGHIVFGIPRAAARCLRVLADMSFVYLLDEYENLREPQQRYVNTLIREKQQPSCFLIGSRLYGLRTHATLSAEEVNKEGSEYQLVILEHLYRHDHSLYHEFCDTIVERRLRAARLGTLADRSLEAQFDAPNGSLEERAYRHVTERLGEAARPWMERLRLQLRNSEYSRDAGGIVGQMELPDNPMHEKLAILLLYRAWADGSPLATAAPRIRADIATLVGQTGATENLQTTYRHYKRDLYAQLLKRLGLPGEYYGFADFVRMSGYLPRNLLVLLKGMTRWSIFLGQQPFATPVSLRAQTEGVREASDWFLRDSKGFGRDGEDTDRAIRRLGRLFQEMRYSDKPVEVGCSSFSTHRQGLTEAARKTLDNAVQRSLIVEIAGGRPDRNTGVLHHKYQLNPMLAPRFGLSLGRRGDASFPIALVNSVFDPVVRESVFWRFCRDFLTRLQPPFTATAKDQGYLPLW